MAHHTPIEFDPKLRQLILQTTGALAQEASIVHITTEEVPVVAKLANPQEPVRWLRVIAAFGDIVTGRTPLNHIIDVRRHSNVVSLKASATYAADLTISVPEVRASLRETRANMIAPVTGKGQIIACADWGLDFAHRNFRDAQGRTRLLYLWDQRGGVGARSPLPFGYGREFTRDEINAALGQNDPYAALGYDPADSDPYGRGTHGTHVCDIAGGNGLARDSSPGVAPEADLLFVHLKGNDTRPEDTMGDSVRLLEAVRYMVDRAAGRGIAINTSCGLTGGPKDGSRLVVQGLDALLKEKARCGICMSAGNYFDADLHSSGRIKSGGNASLAWHVGPRNGDVAEMEVWYDGADEFTMELLGPDGRVLSQVGLGQEAVVQTGSRTLASVFHRRHDPLNADHHLDIFIWPHAPAGTWIVRLYASRISNGRYDAWIERSNPRTQSRFAPECVTRTRTINTISNGHLTVSCAAYDARSPVRAPVQSSSSGPARDGRRKPDISAPGASIRAACSSFPLNGTRTMDGLTVKSGTSMAAPFATGTVALMLEAADDYPLSAEEIRDILVHTARRFPPFDRRDSLRYGAGRLDVTAAVNAVIRQVRSPTTSCGAGGLADPKPMHLGPAQNHLYRMIGKGHPQNYESTRNHGHVTVHSHRGIDSVDRRAYKEAAPGKRYYQNDPNRYENVIVRRVLHELNRLGDFDESRVLAEVLRADENTLNEARITLEKIWDHEHADKWLHLLYEIRDEAGPEVYQALLERTNNAVRVVLRKASRAVPQRDRNLLDKALTSAGKALDIVGLIADVSDLAWGVMGRSELFVGGLSLMSATSGLILVVGLPVNIVVGLRELLSVRADAQKIPFVSAYSYYLRDLSSGRVPRKDSYLRYYNSLLPDSRRRFDQGWVAAQEGVEDAIRELKGHRATAGFLLLRKEHPDPVERLRFIARRIVLVYGPKRYLANWRHDGLLIGKSGGPTLHRESSA